MVLASHDALLRRRTSSQTSNIYRLHQQGHGQRRDQSQSINITRKLELLLNTKRDKTREISFECWMRYMPDPRVGSLIRHMRGRQTIAVAYVDVYHDGCTIYEQWNESLTVSGRFTV